MWPFDVVRCHIAVRWWTLGFTFASSRGVERFWDGSRALPRPRVVAVTERCAAPHVVSLLGHFWHLSAIEDLLELQIEDLLELQERVLESYATSIPGWRFTMSPFFKLVPPNGASNSSSVERQTTYRTSAY